MEPLDVQLSVAEGASDAPQQRASPCALSELRIGLVGLTVFTLVACVSMVLLRPAALASTTRRASHIATPALRSSVQFHAPVPFVPQQARRPWRPAPDYPGRSVGPLTPRSRTQPSRMSVAESPSGPLPTVPPSSNVGEAAAAAPAPAAAAEEAAGMSGAFFVRAERYVDAERDDVFRESESTFSTIEAARAAYKDLVAEMKKRSNLQDMRVELAQGADGEETIESWEGREDLYLRQGGAGDGSDAPASDSMSLQNAKMTLLAAVAGLDRGAAAGSVERKAVLAAAEALEGQSTLTFPSGLRKSEGLWRLVYSSALSAGSGSGGGASAKNEKGDQQLPFFQTPDTGSFSSFGPGAQVGQVYARISTRNQTLDNIVEVFLRQPLPFLPQLGKVVLNLEHKLEVVDDTSRRVKITLQEVTARNEGGFVSQLRLPPLKIPVLDVLSSQGAGIFDTTYCDEQMRITRGDRGEIRIFTKAYSH